MHLHPLSTGADEKKDGVHQSFQGDNDLKKLLKGLGMNLLENSLRETPANIWI